jgi:hypothetical protein
MSNVEDKIDKLKSFVKNTDTIVSSDYDDIVSIIDEILFEYESEKKQIKKDILNILD